MLKLFRSSTTPSSVDVILRVAYDGTAFAGWQAQSKAAPAEGAPTHQRTVEGTLRAAVGATVRQGAISLTSLSRTDKGVSARAQLVRFRVPDVDALLTAGLGAPSALQAALSSAAGPGLAVTALRFCRPSQIFISTACLGKTYAYTVAVGPWGGAGGLGSLPRTVVGVRGPLNVDAMRAAASALVGTHDFGGLAKVKAVAPGADDAAATAAADDATDEAGGGVAGAPRPRRPLTSTIRTLWSVSIVPVSPGAPLGLERELSGAAAAPIPARPDVTLLRFEFHGDAFMMHQLRRTVGALLEVGRGALDPAYLGAALLTGPLPPDARLPYAVAPGRGLVLEDVQLPAGFWDDPDWCNNASASFRAEWGLPQAGGVGPAVQSE